NSCAGGGCCVSGLCVASGALCVVLPGTCSAGRCGTAACGGPGQPCCASAAGGPLCTAPDTKCVGGSCAPCGHNPGDVCCSSPPPLLASLAVCLASGLVCNGTSAESTCVTCGQAGGPCCSGNRCSGGAFCSN